MLSKSELLITKRFLFSKKTEGYVSIFSWFSIIGISLGVAAIIIVMSVMNGFRSNLTERLIGVNSHLNVYSFNEIIKENEIDSIKKIIVTGSCSEHKNKHHLTSRFFVNAKKKLVIIREGDHSLSKKKWLNILIKELKLIIN